MKKVIIKGRWNEPITHKWEGSLIDTLIAMNEYTIENDMPGYFFEIENADREWLRTTDLPIFVNNYGELLAPNDYEVVDDDGDNLLWDILKDHFGHRVEIAIYGDVDNPANISLEDLDTDEVILDAEIYTICARKER